ncbi:probable folate-biopterin transporter 2 [Chenopodium quinoa]|uniref:probable folate-biopterin transporter 2 n=1 Tax=Chenopodium quinoa TaxID=63459 RepID=UPI000B797C6B|nr:probable folate-biopterin transporter 2 [Chenopodium quinoa]
MVEEENPETMLKEMEEEDDKNVPKFGFWDYIWGPLNWLKMLAKEMHWSFVFGVVIVYGFSQGLGGALNRVGTEYYMKDVQKLQPSEAQIYQGFTAIPWMVKPIWGLMTDVVPVLGYHRRPYFIFAGILGIVPMLYLSLHQQMHIFFAVLSLTIGSTGAAIADVTVDACVAQNSNKHQHLAPDMQSLCSLSSSIGSLLGFFLSGLLVHLIGPQGVFGLLAIPAALICLVGITLQEPQTVNFSYKQVGQKFLVATKAMTDTLKLPDVWRPCLYLYLSNATSLNIYDGMFYWYTDSDAGPNFSQEFVGYILSIGAAGAILGSLLYQYALKDHQFRDLCFWSQLLLGLSGMLDLMLVLRLNLKLGIPDHIFAVLDECAFQFLGRLKWMPLLVLSSKLCPSGIEGTFFALIMSIGNIGTFSSSWFGGILLHFLNITRTGFDNLWVAILIRSIARISPLLVIFLVPRTDPTSSILPSKASSTESAETPDSKIELVSLMTSVDRS